MTGFMTTSPTIEGTSDVPIEVFEKFLQALGDASVSVQLVGRLHKALLQDRTFTQRALMAAVLGEDSLP